MSEFACRNGHLMRSSDRVCPECGEPCYTMDGLTSSQLRRKEAIEDDLYARRQYDPETDEYPD